MVNHEFLRRLAERLEDGTTHNPDSRASELKRELLAERQENERLRQRLNGSNEELLDLLAELGPLESRIVRYLWERRTAYLSDLSGPDRPWRDPVEPDSQVKAIRRLGERLLALGSPISVSIRNELVTLDRPADK